MAKAKKPLTTEQKKTKYRVIQYSTFGGEFLSILTPYIVMGAVNYDEWFGNNPDNWKVGLGGSLALALLGIAVFLVGKKKEDEKLTGGYIAIILGWAAVAFIFMLLASIMDQISTIMFFGLIGLVGGFGLDLTSKKFKSLADTYEKAILKVRGKKLEEQIEEEVEKEAKGIPTE